MAAAPVLTTPAEIKAAIRTAREEQQRAYETYNLPYVQVCQVSSGH